MKSKLSLFAFILGSDSKEPLKIEHEDLAWQAEQVERLLEEK